MNREIKFRAWDSKYKTMNYNILICPEYNWGVFSDNDAMCEREPVKYNQIVLMQYIGLKDSNGKEIYEGDIVKWDDKSNGAYWRVCKIEWEQAHYVLNGFSFNSSDPSVQKPVSFSFGAFIYESDGELEVIGNIYENEELLK